MQATDQQLHEAINTLNEIRKALGIKETEVSAARLIITAKLLQAIRSEAYHYATFRPDSEYGKALRRPMVRALNNLADYEAGVK